MSKNILSLEDIKSSAIIFTDPELIRSAIINIALDSIQHAYAEQRHEWPQRGEEEPISHYVIGDRVEVMVTGWTECWGNKELMRCLRVEISNRKFISFGDICMQLRNYLPSVAQEFAIKVDEKGPYLIY